MKQPVTNHLFPQSAGMYFAQRNNDLFIITIKGLFPTLKLDSGFNLGLFLKTRKLEKASKEILDNIEIFPEMWKFTSMDFIDYSVFSKNEYHSTGKLELAPDQEIDIRNKYFYLCQQGVPVTKVLRAMVQEFKVSMDTIINIVNNFDKYANTQSIVTVCRRDVYRRAV